MKARRYSLGLSLVELMVALGIGLLIILAVTVAYMSGLSTQRAQTDATRLQESSRFAFEIVAKAVRRAGFRNTYVLKSPAQEFCANLADPTLSAGAILVGLNDPATASPVSATLTGASAVTIANKSDVIRVRYYGEDVEDRTAADGAVQDCLGNPVRRGDLREDTLFIAADASNNNEPTLFCYTNNAPGLGNVPLVSGVESFQILYGEDTTADGIVDRYVPYDALGSVNKVINVMVSMVIRTPNRVASSRDIQTFNHFGPSYATGGAAPAGDLGSVFVTPSPADGRIRLQFSTVVALRNYPLCPV